MSQIRLNPGEVKKQDVLFKEYKKVYDSHEYEEIEPTSTATAGATKGATTREVDNNGEGHSDDTKAKISQTASKQQKQKEA